MPGSTCSKIIITGLSNSPVITLIEGNIALTFCISNCPLEDLLNPSDVLPICLKLNTMMKLLNDIIEAHGGLRRWNEFNKIEAEIVSGANCLN